MNLLFNHDKTVADWCATKANTQFNSLLCAIGYLDDDGNLIGAAVFHDAGKYDVELSFYGHGTLTLDMCKAIAWVAFIKYRMERVSIHVSRSNKRLLTMLPKLGWTHEGIRRHFFGPYKRDDAIMFGMLRAEASRYIKRFEDEKTAAVA